MSKRKVTIEDLAAMVQRGFKEMAKKTDMDRGFSAVNERLDRIEKLMLVDHKRRIERLEEQVKDLRDLLAVK
jgi:polyhydroxyalkanoate synthesis regulator phasin